MVPAPSFVTETPLSASNKASGKPLTFFMTKNIILPGERFHWKSGL